MGAPPGFPKRESDSGTPSETSLDGNTNVAPTDHSIDGLRRPVASPSAHESQSNESAPDALPVEGSKRAEPTEPVAATSTSRDEIRPRPVTVHQVSTHPGPRPDLNLPSNAPRGTLDPIPWPASTEPAGISPAISPESNMARDTPNRTRLLTEAEVSPRLTLAHRPRSAEMLVEPSRNQPATSSAHADQPLAAHPASLAKSAIRPPVATRSAAARNPVTQPASNPNNSTIQVSIGRVEVRAVFPEPPARRSQPPRSRPTVSLDDYLNPRHRGKG